MNRVWLLVLCASLGVASASAQSDHDFPVRVPDLTVATDEPGTVRLILESMPIGTVNGDGSLVGAHPWIHHDVDDATIELRGLVAVPLLSTDYSISVVHRGSRTLTSGGVRSIPHAVRNAPRSLGSTTLRGVRVLSFAVPLADLSAGPGTIAKTVEVLVSYNEPASANRLIRRSLTRAEQVVARVIPGYSAALRDSDISISAKAAESRPSSARSVFLNEETVVISVHTDGPVRVEAEELRSLGVGTKSVAMMRLSSASQPSTLFVDDVDNNGSFDGADFLVFEGRRLRGEATYYSDVTDTNAYLLRFAGGSGDTPRPVLGDEPPIVDTASSYRANLHFEKEKIYFFGFSLPVYLLGDETTVHNADDVQHERFFWREAHRTRTDPILFDASPSYQDAPVRLAIRLVGTVFKAGDPNNSPQQILTARLNDVTIGMATIRDTADTTVAFEFSSNVLVNGENSLEFDLEFDRPEESLAPNIRIDYLEIDGSWNPVGLPRSLDVSDQQADAIVVDFPDVEEVGSGSDGVWIVADTVASAAALTPGYLVRMTSRAGTDLRAQPGFFLEVAGEQVRSPAPFNLGVSIAELTEQGGELRIARYEHFPARDGLEGLDRAADFVDAVPTGNIIAAGLAFGISRHDKTERFVAAFRNLGSERVETESFFAASWTFLARKGETSSAIEHFGPGNGQGLSLNLFLPDPDGDDKRAVVPTGTIAARGQIGIPYRPELRHRTSDELREEPDEIDLIIVAHPLFLAEAERLAAHRRSFDGYGVRVVDLKRVYDEFNDGVKDPVAIRRFLMHAAENWGTSQRRPSWALLFGDANWDRERRMDGSTEVDFLPSIGVPSTDHLFGVPFADTTLTPVVLVGRIPSRTPAEAAAVVDKLLAYDLDPPASWNKRIVFATGGTNIGERDRLRDIAESLGSWFTSPDFGGSSEVISRSGTTQAQLEFPSEVDGQAVRDALETGALWFDFNGHGATTTLDLNFGFVEDFSNNDRPFVFGTWSCNTGLFTNRDGSLRNESFLTAARKGSIASIGSTTSSFTNMNDPTRNSIFRAITTDRSRTTIGEAFFFAKLENYARYGFGDPNIDGGVRSRNHTLTYSLLGDPSMRLAVGPLPELAVPVESIALSGAATGPPALGDSLLGIRADLWNYGWPLDIRQRDTLGVPVSITLRAPDGTEELQRDTVRFLARSAPIEIEMPLDQVPGEYTVIIVADPADEILEGFEPDNRATLTFLLRGSQPLLLEPLDLGVVDDPDQVEIRLLNPATGPGARFELSTSPDFDENLELSDNLGRVFEEEMTTTWVLSLPNGMRGGIPLWFRAVSTSGDRDLAERFPLVGSFRVRTDGLEAEAVVAGPEQRNQAQSTDLAHDERGFGPGTRSVPIYVEAIGQTRVGLADESTLITRKKLTIRVGESDYRINQFDGLNVLVFPIDGVRPVADTQFYFFNNPGRLDDFERFIAEEVDASHRVIIGTSGSSFFVPEPDAFLRIRDVLASLGGSALSSFDTIDIFGSYALIGGKGAAGIEAKEAYIPGFPRYLAGEPAPFPVELRDTISVVPRAGSVRFPTVGPAVEWGRIAVDGMLSDQKKVELAIVGVRRDGSRDTVYRGRVSNAENQLEISTIDALLYPRIEPVLLFDADTTLRVEGLRVVFDPAPELAIVPSTIAVSPDSLLQGDPGRISVTVANLTSFGAARSVPTVLSEVDEIGAAIDTVVTGSIAPLDSARITFDFSTAGYRGDRYLRAVVNPLDLPADPYPHTNRTSPLSLRVTTDGEDPRLAIFADGNRLVSGDYAAPQPILSVELRDNSALPLDSLRSITLVLDNVWITSSGQGMFEVPGDADRRGRLVYRPAEPLSEGPHDIRVFSKDATGNGDTTEIITFFVERELGLRTVLNWPNPMQKETIFTFTVTGQTPPESGEIAIFTPSGRKIQTIDLTPDQRALGFNRVKWNGRDADGDRLANGVYLYRLRLNADGESVETIEKIAVLR